MTFPLSDQPVLGEWFVFVEMQGQVYNRSFEVQKYGKLENLRILRFQTWGSHSPSGDTDSKEEGGRSLIYWGLRRARHEVEGWVFVVSF